MNDVFNVTLEDDDGKMLGTFAVRHLPRRGDEIQLPNDSHYAVLDVIHEFNEKMPATISLRLKLKSGNIDAL